MKIFVVGANGQIGRHLIKDLATTRHQVTAGVREVATQSLVKKIMSLMFLSIYLDN